MSDIKNINTTCFEDQRPGTSGLRKKVSVFQQPHYLENFIQSLFNTLEGLPEKLQGKTLVLGGDGRFHNRKAIQVIVKMAAANGLKRLLIGKGGLLSTPAVSCLIRKHQTLGGIVLSASHNPGGPKADFGIKYNISNGGPAPEKITEALYQQTLSLQQYKILDAPNIDLDQLGEQNIGSLCVEIIDPVEDYANMMEAIFDFEKIRNMISQGFRLSFDAMHAITGPYANEILVNRLGANPQSIINGIPLTDFGGGHPDPSLDHAKELAAQMFTEDAPDFGAASDGDGDRNMILGKNFFISPSDSLAILTANAQLVPAYRDGLSGVARSMPTSQAVDLVAKALNIPCFETPTGWKFFGNLLDSNKITLCGEESFGNGSNHIREKDGLWAVLFWLNIIASRGQNPEQICRSHWKQFGRHYYTRHDYEALDTDIADIIVSSLRQQLNTLTGNSYAERRVCLSDEFSYTDPVDHSISSQQGIRICFEDSARIIFRLSGTGTSGATLRIYIEAYEENHDKHDLDTQFVLKSLIETANELSGVQLHSKRDTPSAIT